MTIRRRLFGSLPAPAWVMLGLMLLLLPLFVVRPSFTGGAELPPPGEMWFGESFDADTFELRDRTSSVGITDAFAAVAVLTSPVDGEDLVERVYLDGVLVSHTSANAEAGVSDIWGWTLGPLYEPGLWRYEFADLGGNVLASGEIRATP